MFPLVGPQHTSGRLTSQISTSTLVPLQANGHLSIILTPRLARDLTTTTLHPILSRIIYYTESTSSFHPTSTTSAQNMYMKFHRPSNPLSSTSILSRYFRFAILITVLTCVNASVYPTKPTSGTTYTAGQAGQVEWIEDGKKPLLAAMGKMRIELYARNDTFIATLARDIQPMSLHTTVLIPFIAPPNNHQYTMRFITIDPALTVYSATFSIMPNPLTYQLGPRPTAVPISISISPSPNANTILGGAAGPIANRPGIVTTTRYSGSDGNGISPLSTSIPAGGSSNPQTNNAVTRRSPFSQWSKVPSPSIATTRINSGIPRTSQTHTQESILSFSVFKKMTTLRSRRENVLYVERIKFRIVFILWPAVVGLTLAL